MERALNKFSNKKMFNS